MRYNILQMLNMFIDYLVNISMVCSRKSIKEVRQMAGTDMIPALLCQSMMTGAKLNGIMWSMHLC